jgi:LPXTG-motif cell wall-anchored protein
MQRKSLVTLAALSAVCLLPTPGAFAQDTAVANSVMDVGQFRDSLNKVHELFTRIQENRTLALASQDSMIASKYENENRRLLVQSLGILDTITRNWKSADIPSLAGETAEMRSSRSIERLGTADAQRYASESDDTAFVRTTVWDIQNSLNADKLNGRDPIINDRIMSMLDAAIARSQNPSFRVAWHDMNRDLLSRNIEFSRTEEVIPAPARVEETTVEERTEVAEAPVIETPSVETTEERTEVAEAPAEATIEETINEETTTERSGAASLPQTGGDPGMLVLLGSSLAGVGAFLRRRK